MRQDDFKGYTGVSTNLPNSLNSRSIYPYSLTYLKWTCPPFNLDKTIYISFRKNHFIELLLRLSHSFIFSFINFIHVHVFFIYKSKLIHLFNHLCTHKCLFIYSFINTSSYIFIHSCIRDLTVVRYDIIKFWVLHQLLVQTRISG
jgi:hypothetical protein